MQFTLTSLLALCVFTITSLASFGPGGGAMVTVCCIVFLFLLASWDGRLTIVEVLVSLAILGILVAVFLPTKSQSREVGRQARCAAKARRIVEALHAYHADYGCFPPACVRGKDGKPMHSWRVLILPYLGYNELWKAYRMGEPWDGPRNHALAKTTPEEYECDGMECEPGTTARVAVTGPKTLWPEEGRVSTDDIRDGLEQTMVLGEVSSDLRIPWTQPRDISLEEATAGPQGWGGWPTDAKPGLVESHIAFLVAMADGSVWRIDSGIPSDQLRALLTVAGGESVDIRKLSARQLYPKPWITSSGRVNLGLAIVWVTSLVVMIVSIVRLRRTKLAAARAGERPLTRGIPSPPSLQDQENPHDQT